MKQVLTVLLAIFACVAAIPPDVYSGNSRNNLKFAQSSTLQSPARMCIDCLVHIDSQYEVQRTAGTFCFMFRERAGRCGRGGL